jgi:hypothetical protein
VYIKRQGETDDHDGSIISFAVGKQTTVHNGTQYSAAVMQHNDVANGTEIATRHLTVTGILLM